jgi:flagellar basal body-associated protein FliL
MIKESNENQIKKERGKRRRIIILSVIIIVILIMAIIFIPYYIKHDAKVIIDYDGEWNGDLSVSRAFIGEEIDEEIMGNGTKEYNFDIYKDNLITMFIETSENNSKPITLSVFIDGVKAQEESGISDEHGIGIGLVYSHH